jgi:hypothetical protein
MSIKRPNLAVVEPASLEAFDAEEYASGVYAGVQEVLGEADLETVKRVVDEALADVLAVTAHHQGKQAAKEAAGKYAETLAPYVGRAKPLVANSYAGMLRKINK